MAATDTPRLPDNLKIAVVSLVTSLVTPVLTATLFAASGGYLWVSLGAVACAGVAVRQATRVRWNSTKMGLDVRHALSEGARSSAIASLVYSGGVLVLNGSVWGMAHH
jgi:hypothetical protein